MGITIGTRVRWHPVDSYEHRGEVVALTVDGVCAWVQDEWGTDHLVPLSALVVESAA